MLSLALETSTRLGGVALGREEELLAECHLAVRATRSELVLPEVARLLARAGHSMDDVSAVVVGAGPGSFTGVRIAASLAKGLCFEGVRTLYAYSSLAAVAASTGVVERVCVLFPARRGEVYAGAVARIRPLEYELEPVVTELDELLTRLDPERWIFAGAGAVGERDRIEGVGGRVLPRFQGVPRGAALLWLATTQPEMGRVEDPASWEPLYVRAPGAVRSPAGGGS